jgi:putative membrane protein
MRLKASSVRALVLLTWAGFFVGLWVSGETSRYLGAKTHWVVPFGAITLTFAALAYGAYALRRTQPEPLRAAEAVGLFALILPVLAVLLVPRAELGAQAASRKASSRSFSVEQLKASKASRPAESAEFDSESLMDVAGAAADPAYAEVANLRDGSRVRLLGFASIADSATSFHLTRFLVSCCAADALPVRVPVEAGDLGVPEADTWLTVTGTLRKRGRAFGVVADSITPTAAPSDPYLTTGSWG